MNVRWHGERRLRVRHDSVNPRFITAYIEFLRIVVMMTGGPLRVLNHGPVVVHQVEGSVRTDIKVDRPEPAIGRGQKLNALLETPGNVSGSCVGPDISVH